MEGRVRAPAQGPFHRDSRDSRDPALNSKTQIRCAGIANESPAHPLNLSGSNSLSSDMLTFTQTSSSLSHDSSIGLLEFLGFPKGSLWSILVTFGCLLGPLWNPLGTLGVSIGSLWVPSRTKKRPLGAHLGRLWVHLGFIWPTWGHFGRLWAHLGHTWGLYI